VTRDRYPWAIRKIACKTKLNMTFSIDADGDLLYSSKVRRQRTTDAVATDTCGGTEPGPKFGRYPCKASSGSSA
jgi:hypothetical protein